MIEAALNGRLGNQLFQYAAARALALEHGTGVVLDLSRYSSWADPLASGAARALRFFGLCAAYTRLDPRLRQRFARMHIGERRQLYREAGWGYDPLFHAAGAATRLVGYFQSAQYWRGQEAVIRDDLRPARLPRDRSFATLRERIDATAAISLHVRRGDYLTTERELHHVCSDAYYERALHYIRERVSGATVFVFSDEPAWCRTRFAGDSSISIVDLDASRAEPGLDLYLMSRCKHHIISNSTYSWWGAWLAKSAGQIACTPERWFNDAQMNEAAMRDTVPAEWHRIDVTITPPL